MAITYEELERVNGTIKTTDIKGKEYAEVPQRVKAFRMLYPTGVIATEISSLDNGVVIIKATVGYFSENGEMKVLANGYAYEKEGSTFINKTSYIENCETSAVGRALGFAGFGIDTSIASAEEVKTAMANQTETRSVKTATPKQLEVLKEVYTGDRLDRLLKFNNIEKIEDLPMDKASNLIRQLKGNK